jgi:hypothetical protein
MAFDDAGDVSLAVKDNRRGATRKEPDCGGHFPFCVEGERPPVPICGDVERNVPGGTCP